MQRQRIDDPAEEREPDTGPGVDAGDLRSVERLLKRFNVPPPDPFALPRREPVREEAQAAPGALQTWALQPLPNYPTKAQSDGFLAWLFLSLGLMAFACGAAMLIWSVVDGREELWSFGIPLVLGGQGAIIFGLIGLAENTGQRHKQTAIALEEHRQRLTLMQNLALVSNPSPNSYVHRRPPAPM